MATAVVKLLEEILVSRPPGSVVPTTVPLTHFDVYWLTLIPVQRLFFYAVPDLTTKHFTSSIVPALKSSLSLTLQHFFPLSGRLVLPWPLELPYIRCADDDSVSFAVCETEMEFNLLAGDGARSVEHVQKLVPKFAAQEKDEKPLVAVQITVFPSSGFSVGVTYNHVAVDGKAMVHFVKSWASICRSGVDPNCISNCLPVHSRDLISDPGNKLATVNMEVNFSPSDPSPPVESIPFENLRYTFVIGSLKVKELKTWVTRKSMEDQHDPPLRVSTFTVTCALIWVCLLESEQETKKKKQAGNNDNDENEMLRHFLFPADLREKLNLPGNYFGNCVRTCYAVAKRNELVGEDGVYEAAKAIGRAIEEMEKEGMKGAEGWRKRSKQILGSGHAVTVAGSHKFGIYETDFGWGRPKKAEHVHNESFGSIAIAESGSEVGAVEIVFALSAHEFDLFNQAFHLRSSLIK